MTDPLIDSVVGQYQVLSRLGGGAMGVVYKARDTKLGRLRRAEVPAARVEPRRGRQAAVHARSAGGLVDRSRQHLHGPRHPVHRRRPALHRHGLLRRRDAEAAARTGAADRGRGARHRDAGRRRPGARARGRRGASRHQAGQRDPHRGRGRRSWTSGWPRSPAACSSRRPARRWARWPTCRRSSCADSAPRRRATSGPWAWCSTRC